MQTDPQPLAPVEEAASDQQVNSQPPAPVEEAASNKQVNLQPLAQAEQIEGDKQSDTENNISSPPRLSPNPNSFAQQPQDLLESNSTYQQSIPCKINNGIKHMPSK